MLYSFGYSVLFIFTIWNINILYEMICLLQVSYCENDVDCRRLLQLIHFGEKFDSSACQKTCDNCLKIKSFVEKDVTDTAKQLVCNVIMLLFFKMSLIPLYQISVSLLWQIIFLVSFQLAMFDLFLL